MSPKDKPLVWLHGQIKTPPFTRVGRIEAGFLLRRLQRGEHLSMPQSRPMPSIGARCHELRVRDAGVNWRIVYRLDADAIVVAEIFAKKTRTMLKESIERARRRLREYEDASREATPARGKRMEGGQRQGAPRPKR